MTRATTAIVTASKIFIFLSIFLLFSIPYYKIGCKVTNKIRKLKIRKLKRENFYFIYGILIRIILHIQIFVINDFNI